MKTSVFEVHDMLSVLAVDEVEKRICGVPGVESATVNYAAGNATVRYDETLLEVADIKVIVHQRGHQPASESQPSNVSEHEPARKPAVVPTPKVAPVSASETDAATQKAPAGAAATAPEITVSGGDRQQGKATPNATPSATLSPPPKTSHVAPAVKASTALAAAPKPAPDANSSAPTAPCVRLLVGCVF
ncbi:heavy-metal-associated domain-containing protein [Massilia sp. TSP1-1-2]|uniref:heavy-metal-associated domain-containing protein n=1 Tax=Massilia sp. TSP1-1-2 TaxID=2804649 RepID=UPI003CEC0108